VVLQVFDTLIITTVESGSVFDCSRRFGCSVFRRFCHVWSRVFDHCGRVKSRVHGRGGLRGLRLCGGSLRGARVVFHMDGGTARLPKRIVFAMRRGCVVTNFGLDTYVWRNALAHGCP
jgi:hypothetical protein